MSQYLLRDFVNVTIFGIPIFIHALTPPVYVHIINIDGHYTPYTSSSILLIWPLG